MTLDEALKWADDNSAKETRARLKSRAAVFTLAQEVRRLSAAIEYEQHRAGRMGTHGPGCWAWGPQHWECAVRIAASTEEMLARRDSELAALREAVMQMLDDMGPDGHSVCEAAKQLALQSAQAHYCPDWGSMPVSLDDPEIAGCACHSEGA